MKKLILLPLIALLILSGCIKPEPFLLWNFSSMSGGCNDFTVFKTNEVDAVLSVTGTRESLMLSDSVQTFSLEEIDSILTVEVKHVSGDPETMFCDSVDASGAVISIWKALSGTMNIHISEDYIDTNAVGLPEYRLDLTLRNVLFQNIADEEEQVTVDKVDFRWVHVGWISN